MTQIKKAFQPAKNELDTFKDIIKKYLEKLETKQNLQKEIVKEIQILKADIQNFRDGRLDLIEERQNKDALAKKVSIVIIEKNEVIDKAFFQKSYDWSCSIIEMTGTWTNGWCKNSVSGTYVLDTKSIKYL